MSDEIHSQPWSSWQMAEQGWVLLFCRFDRICTACTSWRYSPEISWSCVRRPVPQLAGRPSGSWRTLQDRSWSPISAGGGRAVFLMSMLPSKLIINYNFNFHHQHNQMERIATTWVKYLFTKILWQTAIRCCWWERSFMPNIADDSVVEVWTWEYRMLAISSAIKRPLS